MASFQFELVTPEKLLFSGDVESVVVPGTEGDFEVLALHAPLMSTIRPGVIVVKETAGSAGRRLFVRGGFADVNPNAPVVLTILAEQAIPVEEMTGDRLQAEIRNAEEEAGAAQDDDAKAGATLKVGQLKELQRVLG